MAQIRELVELPLRHPMLFKTIGVKPPKVWLCVCWVVLVGGGVWSLGGRLFDAVCSRSLLTTKPKNNPKNPNKNNSNN